jgi:hypothetical protein
MISPGTLIESKEAVTALMVITVAVSTYGGMRSREINRVLPVFFAFAAVFSIALWASIVLGLNLMSTSNTAAYYIATALVDIATILLALTLAFVIAAVLEIDELFTLRSHIVNVRAWANGDAWLWFPLANARAIASVLKEVIKGLFIMAYIYAVITAAVASYLIFLTH